MPASREAPGDGIIVPAGASGAQRMQLRYGFNEIDGWWHLSIGGYNELISWRLRLMDTRVVRIFVFEQPVPDPVKEWPLFVCYLQGVIDAGAVPMITFDKYPEPFDSPHNLRNFVARCKEIVWACMEQWGGDAVKSWYWCIWNEPNNRIIGGDLTFEIYQWIYEEVAGVIHEMLSPFLGANEKLMIGGPAIDGTHRAYWMDWIARLVDNVDDRLVGFVSWHRYGDWRPAVPSASLDLEMWGAPDPPVGDLFEDLLMAQTPSYEARARGVARLLKGRNIMNVCGELNTIAHHEHYYTLGVNQNVIGGAFYASALIHLIRGGAELEMRWTAIGHGDAYSLMSIYGEPTVAGLVKQLFVQHVRYGDMVRFPPHRLEAPAIDGIIAYGKGGRISGVFVNSSRETAEFAPAEMDETLADCLEVLRIDAGTGEQVVRERLDGTVKLGAFGIAVVTNQAETTVID